MTAIWDAILKINERFKIVEDLPELISIELSGDDSQVYFDQDSSRSSIFIKVNYDPSKALNPLNDSFFEIAIKPETKFDIDLIEALNFYLSFTFCSFFGRKYQKCYAISHFAQTLDGKIASITGDSKWIGNEENLIHAHRMRALCDGILVGSKTLERDNPRLNVRKVKGSDPVKVIIGGNGQIDATKYHAIESSTLVFKNINDNSDKYICIETPEQPIFDLNNILKILATKQIFSVYVEGGSYTTSCFLEQKALDQVQIHFSSKILGSGISSFKFGAIPEIKDAIEFKSSRFRPVGTEMMFIGNF